MKRGRRFSAVLAGALLAASGCIYVVEQPPGVARAPVAQPQPGVGVSGVRPLGLGVGGSAGFLVTSDPWLDPGFMWGVQGSLWFNQMIGLGTIGMGVELDIASATLADTYYGGELTVMPIYVSLILSVPEASTLMWAGPNARWRLGVGFGFAALSHTEASPDSIPIFGIQAGTEWLMPEGGRVFAVVDLFTGGEASDLSAGRVWDLTNMVTFRIGVELGL